MTDINIEPVYLEDIGLNSNMLQSGFWGRLKSFFGWKAFAFRYAQSGEQDSSAASLLVLVRNLGAGQSLAYVPHGPMITADWDYTARLAEALQSHLPKGCMFIRFDPPWGIAYPSLTKEPLGYPEEQLSPTGNTAGLLFKANMDIQPPSTVVLDLNNTEDELLKGMKSKTRYNIKLAAKKGVLVKTSGIEALHEWYELYRITAERDRIALHGYDYYEKIFTLAAEMRNAGGDAPEFHLLQAVIDGVVEAGIIICFQGTSGVDRRATYLYGASSNNKRNCMPAYALQWEAIKQARAAGCTSYDFFGIPPVDNPEHPMYGLYRFKTGFGGEILHRPGCWDYPYGRLRYKIFRAAEKARNFYYKTLKKR